MATRSVKQLFDLTGKIALVTGGSRGLGLQIAEALGEQGAQIVVSSRKQADLDLAVQHLTSRGITASSIAADLGAPGAATQLCSDVLSRLGHVDILVNNAGASWGAPAEDHPLEAWDKIMNLNIRSIFELSQAVGKQSMIPRNQGRIINVASIAGLGGNPSGMQTIAYNTSKGALINFTKTLACEWGKYNITVNNIAPGFFPSKMTKGIIRKLGVENITAKAPIQRLGDNEDLKGISVLYASDAGKHITGQTMAVDGGVSVVLG